jgi:ATP-binding cassette subfamily C (CFTR/MRP) protein 4
MEKIGLPLKFLDKKVGGGANDLSAGQCQLLSFGRTLLSKAKLIVMDEPTSNIDFQTDESIQRVVREEFTTESVITIAHRLNTIIDYDQILVMGEGLLLEKGR